MAQPLRIGPMKPDDYGAAAGGRTVDARSLIAAGEAAYPAQLRAAMGRRTDEVASAALDLGALSGELGVEVVAASVRGFPGEEQVLVYLFREESGRTGRWCVPLEETAAQGTVETARQEAEQEHEEVVAAQEKVAGITESPDTARTLEKADQPAGSQPEPPDPADEPGTMEPPWASYNQETVAEIQDRLAEADDALKQRVAEYEAAHKDRKGVLDSTGG